jgi:CheY-like chemotaxis protein
VPQAPQAPILDSLNAVHVLVVDDEAPVRGGDAWLADTLGMRGVSRRERDEALARVRSHSPDVVLCDLNLAYGESGIDVLARIEDELGQRIPCAFVTGESSADRIATAEASGHTVVSKPTNPGKLRAILEHLAQR